MNNSENMESVANALGIGIKNSSTIQKKVIKEDNIIDHTKEVQRQLVELTQSDRIAAVELGLIHKEHINDTFDENIIKRNVQRYGLKKYYQVRRYPLYVNTVGSILATIRSGQIPRQSYLIGAPNGFGKGSFAHEAIITMNKLGWRTVPFTSLTELAELWCYNESLLLSKLNGSDYSYNTNDDIDFESTPGVMYKKKPIQVLGRYSWSEYINSDCLICYFTSLESKKIESRILFRIMIERGTKGLPTIVCISTSLNPYINDAILKQHIWDEILLGPNIKKETPSRLKHVSCYKELKQPFNNIKREEDGDINDYIPEKDDIE